MTDYLNLQLPEQEIGALSNLALAHIGDCVYELLVRSYIIGHRRLTNRQIHTETVKYVSAAAQAAAIEKLLPLLSEQERAVYRRGRNTRVNSIPKHAPVPRRDGARVPVRLALPQRAARADQCAVRGRGGGTGVRKPYSQWTPFFSRICGLSYHRVPRYTGCGDADA